MPIWATLIALQHDGDSLSGVASAPGARPAVVGRRGGGRVRRRPADPCVDYRCTLADAHLAHAGVGSWYEHGRRGRVRAPGPPGLALTGPRRLLDALPRGRGASTWPCEPIVALWDLAALQVIVEEAGGRFTDLAGRAWPDGESAVSTNGLLHDEVLAALRG